MAMKIKKGMAVVVISGKDRGKEGKVLVVDREKGRVVVEGVNIIKRATRPNPKNQAGGMVEREASIAVSNVSAIDPESKKPTRVGWADIGGVKTRVARRSGKSVEP
jgi:large subunit ribosomal protein L24